VIPNVETVGGYPLAVVARRTHEYGRCVCCGAGTTLWRVSVRATADGRLMTIVLCDVCVRSEDRAWRLSWQPVPYAR
jgi:hypothetical protein